MQPNVLNFLPNIKFDHGKDGSKTQRSQVSLSTTSARINSNRREQRKQKILQYKLPDLSSTNQKLMLKIDKKRASVEMREKNDAIKECIHSISSLTSTATTDAKDSIRKSS